MPANARVSTRNFLLNGKCFVIMKTNYQPISCDFYDELEALAVKVLDCEVVFLDENKQEQTIQTKIETFFIKEKAEFMQVSGFPPIRLDKLVRVNDKFLTFYC
jgi:Rho-binding antiterminator